ncbi:MAG: zinc metallopeptidase [Eubacteriaceae bacterium]|nr:zinc metallopeptidase [Eubacteriaceae bacterium]
MFYDSTYIILIPAILFTLYAQSQVKGAFNRYSKVRNQKNISGAEAARIVLDYNGLSDVKIAPIRGSLTDNYNPTNKVLSLSETVYGVNSIAAISVACHEVGHAIQHANGYAPLKVRNSIVPVVNFASKLTWPMIIIGLILLSTSAESWYFGNMLFNIGVIAFGAIVVFHLITLPVEFNASSRAIDQMMELGLVTDADVHGSKRVLRAAAMTYVAALATAVANLLRILAIRGRD